MRNRLMEIFDLLLAYYGPLHWWPADTPFEVCVGAILTQNTNWGNVEKAIVNLKQEGVLSAAALWDLEPERLAELIRPSGFFNIKSTRLKDFLRFVIERYGSLDAMFERDWRELREELLGVRGIGCETCDSILLYAGGKPSFVVDAYTRRLFSRLGIVKENDDYETVRALFMNALPSDADLFNEYHALIVQHSKDHCRKKQRCGGCPLGARCCCHSLH
ncbi:endonuclease III domain-containing protein [Geomesophilobacter sediminis]|uniref:Endonuclease III domain-containing protein n=1 Tax=Geomesophilobacter sediminis TaxID=2798584 RepID=A0A8J7JED7_9BACT|nr:endonuclease III domain-containing protein [Geomesophilobacter sediminis]MBJ6725631.1 endonuclease III domain-containing protein [Geomesophilobacter sediminis]